MNRYKLHDWMMFGPRRDFGLLHLAHCGFQPWRRRRPDDQSRPRGRGCRRETIEYIRIDGRRLPIVCWIDYFEIDGVVELQQLFEKIIALGYQERPGLSLHR